jgi:LysR family transcriptional regulator, glycine cleavage system transcriptional activator
MANKLLYECVIWPKRRHTDVKKLIPRQTSGEMRISPIMSTVHVSPFETPPLSATRAFEAFARHGSVTAAAAELGLTQSAVSHQLRALELFLRLTITERRGRKLMLTAEGREYLEAIRPAFAMLRAATSQVRLRAGARDVTISVLPLFAMGWLLPKLEKFMTANPQIAVRVLYAQHRNYSSDAADISVRFGIGQWAGYTCERFLPGAVIPACSADYLSRHGPLERPADIFGRPLVHDEDRGHWARWFQSVGVEAPSELPGPLFEDGLLTRGAAMAGLGAALMRPAMIEHEIRSGALTIMGSHYFDDGRDYYLCMREGEDFPEGAKNLVRWLRQEAGSQEFGPGPVSRKA